MGKDKKKPKIPYTNYFMSVHSGLCNGPLDTITRIKVKDEIAWEGVAVGGDVIEIDQPELFGGNEKEGGVKGSVYVLAGGDTQVLPPELAIRQGMHPDYAVGYRHIGSVFFIGEGPQGNDGSDDDGLGGGFFEALWQDANPEDDLPAADPPAWLENWIGVGVDASGQTGYSGGGFMWSQNNPYMPAAEITAYRKPRGLNQTWAEIQWAGTLSVERHKSQYLSEEEEEEFDALPEYVDKQPGPDVNPAHMVYECLTNPAWGAGHPDSLINIASFNYAAELFFNEGLGLSMLFTGQMEIEKMCAEILDHVQASLYVDPRTGLFNIKPFRDDYDVDNLRIVNESNATFKKRGRKGLGEVINEINVTWTNPFTEEEESLTFHDQGQIAAQQGAIVSETRNYYGVRNPEIATKLGLRDIRSAATPLFTCECIGDRTFWDLVPGEVVQLDIAEDGVTGLICRVVEINRGRVGDSAIKFKVTEEIFSRQTARYYTPAQSMWKSPNRPPTDLPFFRMFTVPYPFLAANGVAPAEDDYPLSAVGFLGAHYGNADIQSFEMWSESARPNGDLILSRVGSFSMTGRSTLKDALVSEAMSTITGFGPLYGSAPYPKVADFALIVDPTDVDGGSELAMIDAFDTGLGTITLARGVLDTVPKAWSAGAEVWFLSYDFRAVDPTERPALSLAEYTIRTRSTMGLQSVPAGNEVSFTPNERVYAPFRPSNVKVDGNDIFITDPIEYDPPPATITVTWNTRNRLTEDANVTRWTDASVAPEVGQTTTIRAVDRYDHSIVLNEVTGLAGVTYDFPVNVAMETARDVDIIVLAERDGYESEVNAVIPINLITPAGWDLFWDYDWDGTTAI